MKKLVTFMLPDRLASHRVAIFFRTRSYAQVPHTYPQKSSLTDKQNDVTNGYTMNSQDLKEIREELGLTQQQLAEALHTTRVSVARYEAGMRRIPGIVSVVLNQLRRKTAVPMAGLVAAGSPIEPVPQSELVDIPPSMLRNGKTFALTVKGESMKDDGILPGDLVVVHKQGTAKNGQTVVALVNGEATIKTYIKKDAHIELRPANDTMQPIVIRSSDEFQIEGIVIGVIRHCAV